MRPDQRVQALHTHLNQCYKTPHQIIWGWDTQFFSAEVHCVPLPFNAIKLTYFTQNSLRFDSALVHRDRGLGISLLLLLLFLWLYQVIVVVCGIQFPDWGSNSGPLLWEWASLNTVPPGKSLSISLNCILQPYFWLHLQTTISLYKI